MQQVDHLNSLIFFEIEVKIYKYFWITLQKKTATTKILWIIWDPAQVIWEFTVNDKNWNQTATAEWMSVYFNEGRLSAAI